jgi:hypothetical protein
LSRELDGSVGATQIVVRGASWTQVLVDAHIGRSAYRVVDRVGWLGFRVGLDLRSPSSVVVLTRMQR